MQLLESAMAFAVTMIIFSTITTGVVELMIRLAGTRERNLEKTIRVLFQTVIWPRMKNSLTASVAAAEETLKEKLSGQFVQAMMGNPLSAIGGGAVGAIPARKESQVDELSVLAFAERLGRTDVGKAILAEGEAQLELLVKDFVRTFDRFARASREVFRKKAQQTAMFVGIIFALAANVEAGRLLTTLMEDPNLRTSLIEQVESVAEANEALTGRLADLTARLDESGLEEEQSTAIQANIDEITANMKALETTGLPIGPAYYPYCSAGADGDPACLESKTGMQSVIKFARWFSLSVVAGILIGLGGPFWFRVFSGLSQVFQVLRSLGIGRGGKAAKSESTDAQPGNAPEPEESAKPKSVVDAFKVAVQVHAHRAGSGRRAVLSPDGQPL